MCDVSPDNAPAKSQLHIYNGETGYLDRMVDKWTSSGPVTKTGNSKIHLENCEQCRREAKFEDGTQPGSSSLLPSQGKVDGAMVVKNDVPLVVVDSIDTEDIWQATLAVGGMTCAVCVGAIKEALEKKSWVRKAAVNLST